MASDITQNRIFNIWILPAAATGIISRLYSLMITVGAKESIESSRSIANLHACLISYIISYLISAFLLYLIYRIRGLGAGDVKLILTGSLYMTGQEMIVSIAWSFVIAGIMAVVLLADRSTGRNAARRSLPFAVPYGLSVILLIGGILYPGML